MIRQHKLTEHDIHVAPPRKDPAHVRLGVRVGHAPKAKVTTPATRHGPARRIGRTKPTHDRHRGISLRQAALCIPDTSDINVIANRVKRESAFFLGFAFGPQFREGIRIDQPRPLTGAHADQLPSAEKLPHARRIDPQRGGGLRDRDSRDGGCCAHTPILTVLRGRSRRGAGAVISDVFGPFRNFSGFRALAIDARRSIAILTP